MASIFFKRGKKLFIILGIVIFSLTAFYFSVFSYNDTITHLSLTENIANIYNANFEKKLTQPEINWLRQGSIEEDAAPRWLNHFYNPQTGKGLWSFYSAKAWSQNQTAQSSYFLSQGNQTWQKAIEEYANGNNQAAFVALGHILHLLEDMTVPAHTRLDAHPNGDPYESWVVEKINSSIDF